ncbi:SNO glutamine amidotransferase, partial [Dendrothele bispora CBS 962.96]
ALQGAFAEHQVMLEHLELNNKVKVVLVRKEEDLGKCDGLVIPGGESTTIALLVSLSDLPDPLKGFVKTKLVRGTCAGAILLSRMPVGTKKGRQELLGGMSVTIARNGWDSQVESFEAPLEDPGLKTPEDSFSGIFIHAPVLLSLDQYPEHPPIQIIARLPENLVP